MRDALFYLDQGVVSMAANGIPLVAVEGVQWVYSKEHFREISRAENPGKYLEALDVNGAKLLDVVIDETGQEVPILYEGTAQHHFAEFIEVESLVPIDTRMFTAFIAWVNGGGDEDSLREISQRFVAEMLNLQGIAGELYTPEEIASIQKNIDDMVDKMIEWGNDVKKTRKAFGVPKGEVNNVSGKNQLLQVWELISDGCGGEITHEQFFGKVPPAGNIGSWTLTNAIVGCCGVLDVIGFHSEQKCRKIDKIPNILSDAQHIAFGARCEAICTKDEGVLKRAKAIYEYHNLTTLVVKFQDTIQA